MKPDDHSTCWERGWDGHERAQRERLAKLPLADKIAWLEEAHRVVLHLQAQDRKRDRNPQP